MAVKIRNVMNIFEASISAIFKGNTVQAIQITSQAKALCPVDTGRLRNSITWKQEGLQGGGVPVLTVKPKKNQVFVGTGIEYAPYVEFGTKRQDAQPYLLPAIAIVKRILSGPIPGIIHAVYKTYEKKRLIG